MLIKKGPFGYFATEVLSDELFDYTCEIMEINEFGTFLPFYTSQGFNGTEISFDFSGYIPLSECTNGKKFDKKKLLLRRKTIGNLFYSILINLDYLLSPACLVLDPKYIFTNPDGSVIKLCNIPIYSDKNKLNLSSINIERIETLLETNYFSEVLSEDEKSSIIYSITNNDENLYKSAVERIQSTGLPPKKDNNFDYNLLYALGCVLLSLSTFNISKYLSAIFIFICIYFLIMFFQRKYAKKDLSDLSNERKQILFEDNNIGSLNCAFLKSKTPIDGEIKQFGIYMDRTTIGSDRFLSDIYINHNSLSSLHAIIELMDEHIYITDVSDNNQTFVEDKRLNTNIKYEIKNGQKITIGDFDFLFKVNFFS